MKNILVHALGFAVIVAGLEGCGPGNNNSDGQVGGDGATLHGDMAVGPNSDLTMPAANADFAMAAGSLCGSPPADAARSMMRAKQCGVGTEAPLFLRGAPYSRIIIEVAGTTGTSPDMAAIDHLKQIIATLAKKPGGVTIEMGDMNIAAPGHPLAIDEVRAIEDAHRHRYALADTAVFYYLIVSDPSADDTNQFKVLGEAHRASSVVIFQGSIRSVSGGLGQPSSSVVETTVVAHEFGHMLGLVNLGTPMVTPHEDQAHRAHDVNTKCLMYYANNSSAGLANLLGGGNIADFDDQCKADLAAVRDAP